MSGQRGGGFLTALKEWSFQESKMEKKSIFSPKWIERLLLISSRKHSVAEIRMAHGEEVIRKGSQVAVRLRFKLI